MTLSLWDQMMAYGKTWFLFPGIEAYLVAIAVGVAVVFGVIWLCAHWPPLKNPWMIAVAVVSAFLTLAAIIFIQLPIQHWIDRAFVNHLSSDTIWDWLYLVGLPTLLVSGLVQEGAKMVPVTVWWWRKGRSITPAMGLAIGAVAGAAFGIFEAFPIFASNLGSGWTFDRLSDGFIGIASYWERFFAIAMHTSISALAGWGLAKGKGWQFFLIAAGLHTIFNYPVILYRRWYYIDGLDYASAIARVETIIAVIAVLITAAVLWIRWTCDNSGYVPLKYTPEEFDGDQDDVPEDEVEEITEEP